MSARTKVTWTTTATTTFSVTLDEQLDQAAIDALFADPEDLAGREGDSTETEYACTDRTVISTETIEMPDPVTITKVEVYDPADEMRPDHPDYTPLFEKLFRFTKKEITGYAHDGLDLSPDGSLDTETVHGFDFTELFELWVGRQLAVGTYTSLAWEWDDDVQGFAIYGSKVGEDRVTITPIFDKLGSVDGDGDGFTFYAAVNALDLSYRVHYSDGTVK